MKRDRWDAKDNFKKTHCAGEKEKIFYFKPASKFEMGVPQAVE